MKKTVFFVIAASFFLFTHTASGQEGYAFPDSINYKKNVIKWNLTPFILWGSQNINIGYERVLKPYRSFSVNAGYFVLPSLVNGIYDSLDIRRTGSKWGFTVSGDYRFYFSKRNKRMAPDGLFLGIYGSFHHYEFENTVRVLNSSNVQGDLTFGANLNMISAGVELGYQFIIKERLSIDLVFIGPSLTAYTKKFMLSGNMDVDKENEYLQALYDILSGVFPGLDNLVQTGELSTKGSNLSMGLGMRYLIQVGYRF